MATRRTSITLALLGAAAAVILAACGGDTGRSEPVSGLPDGPSALEDATDPSFPAPLVDPGDIQRVLAPDRIPSIDNPQFVDVAAAGEWLVDSEPVVLVVIEGEARAYPVGILMFHEIVNDEIAGVPIAVTYCPLCNSAVTYDRRVRGEVTTFGTTGRLYNSALVMYDRATQTMWTHLDGRAVVGILAGEELTPIGSPLVAWSDFRDAYPDGLVLDKDRTGFGATAQSYFRNPYGGYDLTDRTLFPADGDGRLPNKDRVVGFTVDDAAFAVRLVDIAVGVASTTPIDAGSAELVVFWRSGQSSALETGTTSGGRDVGSAGVFDRVVDGTRLEFTTVDGAIRDVQTDSIWDVAGRAIDGPLAGTTLTRVPHLDTFWFAWSSYRPDSSLLSG